MHSVPQVMTREGGVPAPYTRLQHLGDSEVLLEQKRQNDTSGLPALGGGFGTDLSESWYALNIFFQSQKETVFFEISFVLCPAVMNSYSHRGRCAAVRSR